MKTNMFRRKQAVLAALLVLLAFGFVTSPASAQPAVRWWKGNLHTHTLWSDGDDFPEMVVDWYKSRGYDFLALSDHNTLQEGAIGVVATNEATLRILPTYTRRFGSNWVARGVSTNGTALVVLKTLAEFRGQFEAPGRFLLIPGSEVTHRYAKKPVQINAINLRAFPVAPDTRERNLPMQEVLALKPRLDVR